MQGRGWILQQAWILRSVFSVMLARGRPHLGPLYYHSAMFAMLAFILLLVWDNLKSLRSQGYF